MHDTAYEIGRSFIELYCMPGDILLELGSMNVNGTLRDFCPKGATYIGLDSEAGPGVDIYVEIGKPLPLRSEFADVLISTSALEHDPCFWETFIELVRVVKPGGMLYLNCPSNGSYHRYPKDYWRFYPDCGLALQNFAEIRGYDLTLVESFTAERKTDQWNDFVAIFVKERNPAPERFQFLSNSIECRNAIYLGEEKPRHESAMTEDMAIIQSLLVARTQANEELERTLAELEQTRALLASKINECEAAEAANAQRGAEVEQLRAELEALRDLQGIKEPNLGPDS